jgi:hypothetical protein
MDLGVREIPVDDLDCDKDYELQIQKTPFNKVS